MLVNLLVNNYVLKYACKDIRQAASLVAYTYEVNDISVDYHNVLAGFNLNKKFIVDKNSKELKVYEIEVY